MSQAISDWDLIVVGAGPAGTATALSAIHAGPRLRVLLVDRADFPRDKSCGDGIAPHVFDRLTRIGVSGVEEGWTPLTRLELARGSSSVSRPMARPVYVIPREVFDARLVERAVAAGATLVRHRVTEIRATEQGVVLDGRFRAPSAPTTTGRTASSASTSACPTAAAPWRSGATRRHRRTAAAPRSSATATAASRRTPGPSTAETDCPTSATGSCCPTTGPTTRPTGHY